MLSHIPVGLPHTPPRKDLQGRLSTEGSYYIDTHLKTYSNQSIELPEKGWRQQNLFGNESAVSFSLPPPTSEDIKQIIKMMTMVRFLAQQHQEQKDIIVLKIKNNQKLALNRQEQELQIQQRLRSFTKMKRSLTSQKRKKEKIRQHRTQLIDNQIALLKDNIRRAQSLHNEIPQKQLHWKEYSSIHYNYQKPKPEKHHHRIHTCMQSQRRQKRKIYVPLIVPNAMPPPISNNNHEWHPYQRQEKYPYQWQEKEYSICRPYRQASNGSQSPVCMPNQGYFGSQLMDDSFTARVNYFNDRLQKSISPNQLQQSQMRRKKQLSTSSKKMKGSKDKGSYIYPSLNISGRKNSYLKVSHHSKKHFSEDELTPKDQAYEKITKKGQTESFKAKKKQHKQDMVPIVDEVNNSTINLTIPSDKKEQSSSIDHDFVTKVTPEQSNKKSGKNSQPRQTQQQSAVIIESKYLQMLDQSPRKETASLAAIPEHIRIMDTDALGESLTGSPHKSYKEITPLAFDGQQSVSSKYQLTPRQPTIHITQYKSQYKSDSKNIFAQLSSQTPKFKSVLCLPQEDEDIMNTIRLSTQSIFSRQKNKSTLSELKVSIPESQEVNIALSDVQDPKSKTQDAHQNVNEASKIRLSVQSQIVRPSLGKQGLKINKDFIKKSIEEANQQEEQASSSKKIPKKKHSKALSIK